MRRSCPNCGATLKAQFKKELTSVQCFVRVQWRLQHMEGQRRLKIRQCRE